MVDISGLINTFANLMIVLFIAQSVFPETKAIWEFWEIVPHSRNNNFTVLAKVGLIARF